MSTLKLTLVAAILATAVPMAAYGAPGDIVSGGGQGGKGGDSNNGNGGGGGAGGLAGGGGGGGGGQGGVASGASVDGGGGGSGASLGGAAGAGANGDNSSAPGGLGGLVLGGDASSAGGGGGGAGGTTNAGGAGGNSVTPPGNVSADLNTVLSSAIGGLNGDNGSTGPFDAAGGGGSGGQGGLVLTGPNAMLSTGGTSVSGGNGGNGATAAISGTGGGGGGGAGVVLVSGGTIQHDGSVIVGGSGGAGGLGADAVGGGGGAGVFLVDGGTLFNNAGTVQGGAGGDGTSGAGGQGGAAVLANRGAVNNAALLRGGNGGFTVVTVAGAGGDAVVANGTAIANGAGGQIIGGRGGDGFSFTNQPGNGGAGVRFINTGGLLQNAGTISGGAAGTPSGGPTGVGGTGVIAQGGATVTNSGTIIGGGDGFSGARANAVELSGGANRLTLLAGSAILGNVVSTSGTTLGGDILALGGDTTDASTTFDVGQVGSTGAVVQYQGFNSYEKTGASTWTLTGSNAGVTPWTLSAGTLVVGADAALGNVAGALTLNGGTLRNTAAIDTARAIVVDVGGGALDTQQPLTLQGMLSGGGALAKTGAATLTVNGTSTYTGAFALQAGKLVVGDATHAGAVLPGIVTVASGATLGGQGTVGGAVIGAGGILAPGNSIGTLYVTGDFTMAPGAVYQVEVDSSSSASDRIVVGGTATLAGSVVHVGPDGNFSLARDYTIVTAAGGLQGTFNSVASNYAFLDPKLSYGANDATLRMQLKQVPVDGGSGNGGEGGNGNGNGNGNGDNGGSDGAGGSDGGTRPIRYADAAETGNQRAVANAVQSMPQDNAVYSRVLNLPAGAPPAAFDALSGEIHSSTIAALHGVGNTVASLPMAHLRANLYAGQTAGEPTAQAGSAILAATAMPRPAAQPLWAEIFGNWRTLDGDGNAGRLRQSDGGLFVGGDHALGAGWRLGGALGYTGSHLSLRDRASTAGVDSYSATLYGGKAFQAGAGHIEWTAGAAYTWHDIDTRRDTSAAGLADTLRASYHAGTSQVFTELGYRLPVGDRMAVQPFAGANYSDLRVRGFSESGGVAALNGESQRSAVTTTTLGLRGELRFESAGMPGRVHAMAGWRHAFGDLQPSATMAFSDSVPFTVAGTPIAQDAAVMGLGIDMRVTKSTTLGLAYNGQFGGGNRQNAGSLSLAWRF
ncbi:autotransporter family protein [Achromobacter aloeverae]|uniref:autotransporter family protein n=1 Tax=Achromobacter aloeverae TaxID=1750518 RepID=UPI00100E6C9D|nr:autotransporter domain-containing protein [Achromobacter aloeverae]